MLEKRGPPHPELDRHLRGPAEVDRSRPRGVVDAVEGGRCVGVVGERTGRAECHPALGRRRLAADRVRQGRARRLPEAPVVEQAGGPENRRVVGAAHGQRPRRGRGGAVVVGDPQADVDGRGARVGAAGRRGRPGVGLVGPVAVEVPLVAGDRAVGVGGGRAVEADGLPGRRRVGRDREGGGRGAVLHGQRAGRGRGGAVVVGDPQPDRDRCRRSRRCDSSSRSSRCRSRSCRCRRGPTRTWRSCRRGRRRPAALKLTVAPVLHRVRRDREGGGRGAVLDGQRRASWSPWRRCCR